MYLPAPACQLSQINGFPHLVIVFLDYCRDQMERGATGVANETDEHGSHAVTMAEIVVPDSYSGFVRILLFLYTGTSAHVAVGSK